MARQVTAVLSGGGAKAAAHLGALEILAQNGIVPTRFVGTSMGAVIAAGLAAGLSVAEVQGRLRRIRKDDVAKFDRTALVLGVFSHSLLNGPRLRETLGTLLPVPSFADLKLPLSVTAADLDTGELVVFGSGGVVDVPLADALYASCALPVLYPPAELLGRRLADGGLRAVVALEVAARFPADTVVAIDVGPGFDAAPSRNRPPPALIRAHNDSQFVLMATNTALQVALWRATPGRPPLIYIRPEIHRGETFAIGQADAYVEAGRDATKRILGRPA